MKYWIFQHNQVLGPYDGEQISQVKGFNAESLVCPEGRKGTEMGDWQRAGVVSELADSLLKTSGRPVATATRSAGEALLPPEPTLRDLAVLGTLQEKTSILENAINQLQEDLHTRDTELSRLKIELASKERALHEFGSKLAELEGRVITLSSLKDDVGKDERQIRDLSEKLVEAREELRRDLQRAEDEEKNSSAKLAEDERQLSELAAKLAEKERHLDDVMNRLSEQERRLDDLNARIDRPGAGSPSPMGGRVDAPKPAMARLDDPKPLSGGPAAFSPTGNLAGPSIALPTGLGGSPITPMPQPVAPPPPAPEPSAAPQLTPLGADPIALTPFAGGATPFPTPLAGGGAAEAVSPPQAFVALNEPTDLKAEPGLTDLSSIAPAEPPKPAAKPKPAEKPFEPEEMVAGKSLKKRGSGNGKVVALIVAVTLVAGGIAAMFMKKPAKTPVAPELTPPMESPAPSMPTRQSDLQSPPSAEPADPALAAVDLAKNFVIPAAGVTLQQRLEKSFPPDPKSALSSWMVEKLEDDKFQVNYYTNHEKLVYQFLVKPQAKILQGINPEAMAVINGEEPKAPARAKAKGRGKKAVASAPAVSPDEALLPPAEPAPKPKASRRKPAALPGAGAPKRAVEPPSDPAADEKSIDELLLPGMGKPLPGTGKGGRTTGGKATRDAADDIPTAEELTAPADEASKGLTE